MEQLETEVASEIFREAVDSIAEAYVRLGHQSGWVFLHTPAKTLSPTTRLFLIALNPASKEKQNPAPEKSDETGNAYRKRNWRGAKPSPLQKQVCAFYELVAAKLGTEWQQFMDSSLAGNFCPFGSPSWQKLDAKGESVAFSTRLWSRILGHCRPSVIVCLGAVCYQSMSRVASECRYCLQDTNQSHGWGRYRIDQMAGPNQLLLVRLPHLSRYRIFNRASSAQQCQLLADKIAEYLSRPSSA